MLYELSEEFGIQVIYEEGGRRTVATSVFLYSAAALLFYHGISFQNLIVHLSANVYWKHYAAATIINHQLQV